MLVGDLVGRVCTQSLASFKGDAEFYTWLYRIAFNTAVSLKRRRRALVSLETGRDGDAAIDPQDPSEETRPGVALERTEGDPAPEEVEPSSGPRDEEQRACAGPGLG